jgi:hypothetical protein
LAGVIGLGVALALALLLFASSAKKIEGLAQAFLVALGFNALSYVSRWLLTNVRGRIWLKGGFPWAMGLAKVSGLVACATLLLAMLAGLIAGPPFAQVTLSAMVMGLLTFAILASATTGILNVIIVTRHFRGTLLATSQQP